jgi:DNA-binding Lrp family transcriptional regulator
VCAGSGHAASSADALRWQEHGKARPRAGIGPVTAQQIPKGFHVITAFVLIKTDAARIPETAEEISAIPGISEVYSVTGEWDLIAIARVRKHEDLADVIADKLSKVPAVIHTTTHIAFRAYSQHDLDAAFALGFEQ